MAKTTTQVNTWEAQMAKDANVAAKAANKTLSRPMFATGGTLSFQNVAMPEGAAITVLHEIYANMWYSRPFDPKNPTNPDCWAFGEISEDGETIIGFETHDGRKELAPHKSVKNRVCDSCAKCKFNEYASAPSGGGKACQNTHRLAVVESGTIDQKTGEFSPYTKPEQIEASPIAFIKVPPTSVAPWSKLVVNTQKVLGRSMWGMFTHFNTADNPKGGLPKKVLVFDNIDVIPNNLMPSIFKRLKDAKEEILFPFGPPPEGTPPPAKRKYAR